MSAHAESAHLLISQIQIGEETPTDEFVELYNPTDVAVSIADWKLTKRTSTGSAPSNLVAGFAAGTIIGPHKYFLITHKTGYKGTVTADTTYSGSSFYISADYTITLSDASGAVVDKVGFGKVSDFEGASAANPEAGQSLKRKGWESGAMQDTENNQNDFTVGASSPRNSSWGGIWTPPNLPVLGGGDSGATTTQNILPLVRGGEEGSVNFERGQLLINEVYPVADAGEKEWIELWNPQNAPVSLDGWTMEDGRDLIASLYGTINKYSVWEITPSRLNNDGDTIKLKSPNGQIIDLISYGKMSSSTPAWPAGRPTPKAGESLARKIDGFYTGSANDFVITQTPTMGEANVITAAEEEDSSPFDKGSTPPERGEGFVASSTPKFPSKKSSSKTSGVVSANGIVLVPPGTFALTYFYILKDDGGAVQVYGSKKAYLPPLAAGDYIYVYGAMGSISGEERIKVKQGGIKKLGKKDLPPPDEFSIDELDEGATGLVKISGEITEKKSAGMYLDDGTGEIYINVKQKAGISLQDILPGNKVEITGILISNNKGLSLLPRFNEDIKKLEAAEPSVPKDASFLVSILKYALPSIAAIGLGVAAYFWRMKKRLIFEGSQIVDESANKTSSPLMGED